MSDLAMVCLFYGAAALGIPLAFLGLLLVTYLMSEIPGRKQTSVKETEN